MKYLLYYNLDSKFKSDQASVSGDGTSVVSVVDGVAWTEDTENVYYRYRNPDSENLTSYTITIHYKDINGDVIAPDDVITVDGYSGYGVSETIIAKSIDDYTILSDDVETLIVNRNNIEHTFTYVSPLMFHILSNGTIMWVTSDTALTRTVEYKKNNGEWTSITSNTGSSAPSISVSAGDVVRFRGNNASYGTGSSSYNSFSGSTAKFELGGSIMSLLDKTNFATATTLSTSYTFYGLFTNCTGLTSAEKLVLPATTLADYCYQGIFSGCTSLAQAPVLPSATLATSCYCSMFQGCTNLTTAPVLPATTLTNRCYESMFQGCTNLTKAPKLPSERLAEFCYRYMFYGCTSLEQAPELPAYTLAYGCYYSMFQGCTSLTKAPKLPGMYLADYCYGSMFQGCANLAKAPELPGGVMKYHCYYNMFWGCTSLTKAPELPATQLAKNCYYGMFGYCTSLTQAPELPATKLYNEISNQSWTSCYAFMFNGCTSLTRAPELPAYFLVEDCYRGMFKGCTNLNYIKCLAGETVIGLRVTCTGGWVNGVAASGTFIKYKNASMTWGTGADGIPSGWTVEDATS